MTESERIIAFTEQRTLALAGASRNGKKFGNTLLKDLANKGYTVHPVHPSAESIDGVRAFPSLAALPEAVGGLVLVVPPAESEKLVREAADAGIPRIWMQQGAESPEAIRLCEERGLECTHGYCLLMFADPVNSIHRVHRWFAKVFGKLPKE
ncbi:MAG: CoA-binding protein [Bacteroidia bacterium]|nr:CoA-binding protein [Bacteroidia bacterium]